MKLICGFEQSKARFNGEGNDVQPGGIHCTS